MVICIPRDILRDEKRVPLFPDTIPILREAVKNRNLIFLVEHNLGKEIGLSDTDWRHAGAIVTHHTEGVYKQADLIIKVKQPLEREIEFYRSGQGVSCFHHVAANRKTVER